MSRWKNLGVALLATMMLSAAVTPAASAAESEEELDASATVDAVLLDNPMSIDFSTYDGADTPSAFDSANTREHPKTVVIDGREYGPKDGLEIDTMQFEVEPGSGPVGAVFDSTSNGPAGLITPLATWGSSYAISTEKWQLYYEGKAKAAANVFGGKRIIEVCIWYTRGGVQKGDRVCSNAVSSGGGWWPGSEARTSVWDSLHPWAPPTIFNMSTVRINPNIS